MKKLWLVLGMVVLCAAQAQAGLPMQQSFAPLVKKSGPAVVNIYTKRVVRERMRAISPFMNDPFFNRFFEMQNMNGPVRERIENSLGSGVIVEEDGLIATNYHVIKGATEISVITTDGREFEATKVLEDEHTDMAILKIDTKGAKLPVIELTDSDAVEVGDIVLAIGNPFGVGQTVTSGIVSAVARTHAGISDYSFFIQTDAAINPGNSGGALIDVEGRLIGINTAIYSKDGGSLGIGFAIPSAMVKSVIRSAKSGGKLVRPWVGLIGQSVSPEMTHALGMERARGALIQKVYPGSAAQKAGIMAGDVILSIEGKEVNDPSALKFRLATLEIGTKVELELLRKGKQRSVTMVAEAPPETPARDAVMIDGINPLKGAVVANLSPALLAELGDVAVEEGVVVLEIKGGDAARIGLQPKDVLLSVNGEKVSAVKPLVAFLGKVQSRQWEIILQRGARVMNLTLSR